MLNVHFYVYEFFVALPVTRFAVTITVYIWRSSRGRQGGDPLGGVSVLSYEKRPFVPNRFDTSLFVKFA